MSAGLGGQELDRCQMGLGPLVMGLLVVESRHAWGKHTDALEYWLAQRLGMRGLPVQGPSLRNLLTHPEALRVPAWIYPLTLVAAVQLSTPQLSLLPNCMCALLHVLTVTFEHLKVNPGRACA
jgi:hypothetical protein